MPTYQDPVNLVRSQSHEAPSFLIDLELHRTYLSIPKHETKNSSRVIFIDSFGF
jgi:hypothetical protein